MDTTPPTPYAKGANNELTAEDAFRYTVELARGDYTDSNTTANNAASGAEQAWPRNVHTVYDGVVSNNTKTKVKCVVVKPKVLDARHSDGKIGIEISERMFTMHTKLRHVPSIARLYPRATLLLNDISLESMDEGFGANGTYNIVLENLDGYSPIAQVLQQHGYSRNPRARLSIARMWTKQLVESLSKIHDKNILLRSLNANNIYVSPDGSTLKILSLHESGILCPLSDTEVLISGRLIAGPDLDKQRVHAIVKRSLRRTRNVYIIGIIERVRPETKAYIKTLINSAKSKFSSGAASNDVENGRRQTNLSTICLTALGVHLPHDIWSLGILLFEIVSGRTSCLWPFIADEATGIAQAFCCWRFK